MLNLSFAYIADKKKLNYDYFIGQSVASTRNRNKSNILVDVDEFEQKLAGMAVVNSIPMKLCEK
jgi:hypothetical protein